MGALLDTHALIWWVESDTRVTPKVQRLLTDPDEDIYVSAVTALEIATKLRIGKLKAPRRLMQDFVAAIESLGFLPLPISLRHGYDAGELRGTHRDPFDRLLAAQARAENLLLVTRDRAFNAFDVDTIW